MFLIRIDQYLLKPAHEITSASSSPFSKTCDSKKITATCKSNRSSEIGWVFWVFLATTKAYCYRTSSSPPKSIVTVALSVTIRSQFAIECLRRSNQRGGSLWTKISGCSPRRLTNREIILEKFQPMWSQSTNVTDGQTDRRHAIARPRYALKCIVR